MTSLLSILLVLSLGAIIFLFWKQNTSKRDDSNKAFQEFFRMSLEQQNQTRTQLDARLKDVNEVLQKQNRHIGDRLDNAAKVVNTITAKLSSLEESNKRIHDIGKDISSLQEILRAPKLRGGLGELFLENLLAQILPRKELYGLQYAFRSGEKVDAVIFLRDRMMVSVDAKFPLENFRKMLDGEKDSDPTGATKFRKLFVTDVKKHVDAIASKYILPAEGTLDFALMYIPAENVYYETITKDLEEDSGLCQYALSKKVIPVSPNTFYIYLQTLLVGLRGMQIEEQAHVILKQLSQLKTDFGKFAESFELVGSHLSHTVSSYERSEKQLSKMSSGFVMIEGGEREHVKIDDPNDPKVKNVLEEKV